MFISRVELLPEDETTAEHDTAKVAETKQIEADRNGEEGLFKGAFHHVYNRPGLLRTVRAPIRDLDDGVDRCPQCTWELEDGVCLQCGFNDDDASDFSGSMPSTEARSVVSIPSSELDGDIDIEDEPGAFQGSV